MKRITTLRFGYWRTWKICFKENKALRSSRPDELSSFSVWGEKETILVNSCKCECWWVAMASWPVPVIGKTCDGLVPCPYGNGQWTNIDKWQTVISKQLARRRRGRSAVQTMAIELSLAPESNVASFSINYRSLIDANCLLRSIESNCENRPIIQWSNQHFPNELRCCCFISRLWMYTVCTHWLRSTLAYYRRKRSVLNVPLLDCSFVFLFIPVAVWCWRFKCIKGNQTVQSSLFIRFFIRFYPATNKH